MQGQRSTIDPIPENVDINLGSFPNNDTMNEQAYLTNRSNPNYMDSTDEVGSSSSTHDNAIGGWNLGHLQNSECVEMKMDLGWSPSRNFCTGAGQSSSGRQLEPQNTYFPGIHDDQMSRSGGSIIIQEDRSSELDRRASFGASLRNLGNSSHMEERTGGSSSSMASWGSSCKRKAFEGTSGSTSSGFAPQDDNFSWPAEPSSSSIDNPPDIMNLSSPHSSWNTPRVNFLDPLSQNRTIVRAEEPVHYNVSPAGTGLVRRLNAFPLNHLQRPGPSGDSLDSRSSRGVSSITNPSQTQLNSIHAPRLSRNMHGFPWNGPRNANFVNSSFVPGDEPNLRGVPRYTPENLAADSRNMTQDSTNWNIAASGHHPSSSRSWSSSPSWASHQRVASNRQRSVESAPWSLFPSVESESQGQSSHFTLPSLGNSAPRESHRQLFHRSAFNDRGGDMSGMSESLRVLAADFEGRHRILAEIRQVLNAVRRGENVRAEDYMYFEPIMFQSLAEMHDRHRDMRLDVDNMSYEELLALGERIGDVNTGLKEETILKHLQHKPKEVSNRTAVNQDPEPCCVCQEEYGDGEDVGLLDCGHDFHVECIKQWLMHKNLCPICKTTGLSGCI